MHVNVRHGAMFQYTCRDCGYKREGLLDHPMYSWNCPKCGGAPQTEEVPAEIKEGEQTPTNSVRDAIALNTLRNKFEEIYRVHGQDGASYLYQEMMREFDEFIAAQRHP